MKTWIWLAGFVNMQETESLSNSVAADGTGLTIGQCYQQVLR